MGAEMAKIYFAPRVAHDDTIFTNDPALPDSPDRSDLAGGGSGWGGIQIVSQGFAI